MIKNAKSVFFFLFFVCVITENPHFQSSVLYLYCSFVSLPLGT